MSSFKVKKRLFLISKEFKVFFRNTLVEPWMKGHNFRVYNGAKFIDYTPRLNKKFFLKFGEFSYTRKLGKHPEPARLRKK